MQYYTSPRTRLSQSRRRFRIRHAAAALTAIGALSVAATLFAPDTVVTTADALSTPAAVAVAAAPVVADAAPVMAPAPAADPALNAQLTNIHAGIQNLLQASTELLVSKKTLLVGKGDTLMDLLIRNKVPRNEAHEAIAALSKLYNPRDLNAGREITVFFHQAPNAADPMFKGLEIEKDPVSTVKVNRTESGGYLVDRHEKQVLRETKAFQGKINSSLYVSAKAAGVPDAVILNLIKMYSWNVDFQRDVQAGDSFAVMYDQMKTEDGNVIPGKNTILYAKLTLNGTDIPYYRYEDRSGGVDYYDANGRSAKKSLMKTPIDGARISSGFGQRRHPVLGFTKMHKGIDFAAPRGTPIYAAGDGKIVKMGPFSSYGNYVRISHRNGFDTAYAHMNGFKSGLRSGMQVKQGEVIGYVGTTGRSTGPHLHYEILQGGKHVNPTSVKVPTGTTLAGRDLAALKAFVGQTDRQFDKIGEAPAIAAVVDSQPVKSASIAPVASPAAAKKPAAAAKPVKKAPAKEAAKKPAAKKTAAKKAVSKPKAAAAKKAGPRIARADKKRVQTAQR